MRIRRKLELVFLAAILSMLTAYLIPSSARASDKTSARQPLTGRVELVGAGAEPKLPEELLSGAIDESDMMRASAEQSASLPSSLKGQWDGKVSIIQMETYPEIHPEWYCRQFIAELDKLFHKGQTGSITLDFRGGVDGRVAVASSDVWFARRLRVMLTSNVSPALVPGGTNFPIPVRNQVTELGSDRVEQTRIDYVRIIDASRRLIHTGFTEVSALYQITGPRRMRVKILNVDYDQHGKPLWKALMEGEARRWSSR